MGKVIDIPVSKLLIGGGESAAHIFDLHVAIDKCAIGAPAMFDETRLFSGRHFFWTNCRAS